MTTETDTSRWINYSVKNLRTGQCVLVGSNVVWSPQMLLDMTRLGRLNARLGDRFVVIAQHYASDDGPDFWAAPFPTKVSSTRVEKTETVVTYRLIATAAGDRELREVA